MWLRVLARLRGASAHMGVGMVASALFDTLLFLARSERATSPKCYASGVVRSREEGTSFYVRAGTDDIYSVMPHREADVDDFIRSHIRPHGAFVDVGANAGYYSIVAGKIAGRGGRVVAVEPVPSTFEVLVRNLSMNGLDYVEAINKACWDSRAKIPMRIPGGNFGWASAFFDAEGPRVSVDGCPLDELTNDIVRLDIVKIDVEGAELRVLRGARRTLSKTEHLVIEVTRDREDVLRLLTQSSFRVREMNYPHYVVASRA